MRAIIVRSGSARTTEARSTIRRFVTFVLKFGSLRWEAHASGLTLYCGCRLQSVADRASDRGRQAYRVKTLSLPGLLHNEACCKKGSGGGSRV